MFGLTFWHDKNIVTHPHIDRQDITIFSLTILSAGGYLLFLVVSSSFQWSDRLLANTSFHKYLVSFALTIPK